MIPVRQVLPDSATEQEQRERERERKCGAYVGCGLQTVRSRRREVPALWVCLCFCLTSQLSLAPNCKQDTHPQLTQRRTGYSYRYLYTGIYSYLKVSKYLSIWVSVGCYRCVFYRCLHAQFYDGSTHVFINNHYGSIVQMLSLLLLLFDSGKLQVAWSMQCDNKVTNCWGIARLFCGKRQYWVGPRADFKLQLEREKEMWLWLFRKDCLKSVLWFYQFEIVALPLVQTLEKIPKYLVETKVCFWYLNISEIYIQSYIDRIVDM